MDLQRFQQSGQWHLVEPVNYFMTNRTFKNLTDFWNFDAIEYVLIFERNPTFYVTVIIIPAIMMGAMSILALILPVESGEKISLAVTILLAQVVELLVLSDILPPSTEEDFPIAGSLVVFLIILASISLIVSVFSSSIHYTPVCKAVPRCIIAVISSRIMTLFFIARLNVRDETKAKPKSENKEQQQAEKQAWSNYNNDTERAIKSEHISEVGWKMLAALIDRILLICYSTALISGAIYYYIKAISG